MSEIEVRELNENEYNIWDELVENSPHGTIFHSSDWLTMCSESFNRDLKIYGCFENDALVGGCSLFVHKSKGFLKVASSTCKMNPRGGIVLRQPLTNDVRKQVQDQHNLVKSLCNSFYKEGFDSIRITNSAAFLDIRPFTLEKWNCNVSYTYYLDLEEDVEKNIPWDVQRSMEKSLENGIQIKKVQDLKKFYDLYCGCFKRLNLKPPANEEFYNRVAELLKHEGNGEVWISETESEEVIAGQILLRDNKRVYSWVVASNPALRRDGSDHLLYYAMLQDLRNRGIKEINLMTATVPQITNIVAAFNPKLMPYYRVYNYSNRYRLVTKLGSLNKRHQNFSFPCSLKLM